jgi:uncharacterized protein involved in exopolysaccharide biosynthesis
MNDALRAKETQEEEELSLIALSRVLFARKWTLLLGTLAVGIVTACVTLLQHNIYESSAALVIRVPQVPMTGEAAPLAIEMLQGLAESAEVKRILFDRLVLNGVLPRGAKFQLFQESLQTNVNKRGRPPTMEPVPMIVLLARNKSPEAARDAANAWADIITSKSTSLYTRGVNELKSFTDKVNREADSNLTDAETTHTKAMLESNLAVNKATMEAELATYSDQYTEYLKLCDQCASKQSVLEAMRRKLKDMEVYGEWVGNILWSTARESTRIPSDATTPTLRMAYRIWNIMANDTPAPADITTSSLRLARTIQDIIGTEQSLATLQKTTQLQFQEMDLKAKEIQLENVSDGVVDARNALAKMEKQHEVLSTQLKDIPQVVTLRKSIPDSALFTTLIEGKLHKGDTIPELQTEERNPVYETVRQSVAVMAGEIEGLKKRAEYYEMMRDKLKDEVAELASRLEELQGRRAVLQESIKDNKYLVAHTRLQYQQTRNDIESHLTDLNTLLARKKAKGDEVEGLRTSIRSLEKQVFKSQQYLDFLQRKVEDYKQVRGSFASKAQEVALLTISAKQASRSGTTLLYGAEANPLKVGPHRSVTVLASMAIAFVLLSFLIIFHEMVLRQE